MTSNSLFDTSDTMFESAAVIQPKTVVEYTVSDLAGLIKSSIEKNFGHVRLRGEISQPKLHSSGHLYFRLKDENAVIEAICWRGTMQSLTIKPEEGMEVICTGKVTTYPGRSLYQIIVQSMEVAGLGALMKILNDLKNRLAEEGLFDQSLKKKLPFMPRTIGVITSPTGAVIQDILHRLRDRFPVHVLVWPVAVQGINAAGEVVKAIEGFQHFDGINTPPKPDLLILARGGGSFEDLMPFNDEALVRAIVASNIPIISAIGHETDTTLADFAADLRAPTPTAAAELAVPVRRELILGLAGYKKRMASLLYRFFDYQKQRLLTLKKSLIDPKSRLQLQAQRLDDRAERLQKIMGHRLALQRQKLLRLSELLKSYSYGATLARGFTMLLDPDGKAVMVKAGVREGLTYGLVFQDGEVPIQKAGGEPKAGGSSEGGEIVKGLKPKAVKKDKFADQPRLF